MVPARPSPLVITSLYGVNQRMVCVEQVKSEYVHHKVISGAIGVKICATGIEKAVAGTPIMVVGPDDDEEDIKEEVCTQTEEKSRL